LRLYEDEGEDSSKAKELMEVFLAIVSGPRRVCGAAAAAIDDVYGRRPRLFCRPTGRHAFLEGFWASYRD
jgi:hypothetical protein